MSAALQPVVIGAGPAGIRAAQTLLRYGLRPVVVDEAPLFGGQIYRQPPAHFQRSKATLYGFDTARAHNVHAAMQAMLSDIDYRGQTLVWNAEGGKLDLLHQEQTSTLAYSHLIVATGATDRVLPFAGWTTPGVFTLGGAQVALKYQGCAIGSRVAFLGTGPLLYLTAWQYAKAGAQVAAVLDTATFGQQVAALPALMADPGLLARGLYLVAWLRAHGVALHRGVRPLQVMGESRVRALRWSQAGTEHELECDAVGFGYGLQSETQLADILGCRFGFNALQRAWLPECDAAGRTSVAGVYLAGDGAAILGAEAAEWAGERAALALLADTGRVHGQQARGATLERQLARKQRFRAGLERAFPFPAQWAAQAPDDLLVCRCEEVSAGQLRRTSREDGATELNRLKALTRVGMGRCQGRVCAAAAGEILAHCSGQPVQAAGRLRGQPPIKPIPFRLTHALAPQEAS